MFIIIIIIQFQMAIIIKVLLVITHIFIFSVGL